MEVDPNPRIRARSELPEGWAESRFDVLNGLGDEGDVEPTITHLKNKLQALQGSRVRRKESSNLGKHVSQSSKGLEAQSGKQVQQPVRGVSVGCGGRGRPSMGRSRGMDFSLRGGGLQRLGRRREPDLIQLVMMGEFDKQDDKHNVNKLTESPSTSDPSSSGKFALAAMEVESTVTRGSIVVEVVGFLGGIWILWDELVVSLELMTLDE